MICIILLLVEFLLLGVSFFDFISISYYDEFININRKLVFKVYRIISVLLFIIAFVCGIICLSKVHDLKNIIMYIVLFHLLCFSIILLTCHIIGKTRYYKTLSKYISIFIKNDSHLSEEEFIAHVIKTLAVTYNMMYRYRDVKHALKKYKVKGK